jgi:prepilin-type N-terminal cleavage/methylation domain-containing protein
MFIIVDSISVNIEMSKKFSEQKQLSGSGSGERGFSMIELIIVALIVAIMITASIPAIQRNLQLYRLESASGLVASRLMEARMVAIKRNRRASVTFNASLNTLEISSINDSGQNVIIGSAISLPQDVTLLVSPTNSISFTSLGRNQSNNDTNITLTHTRANYCKTVAVSAVGKITTSNCS